MKDEVVVGLTYIEYKDFLSNIEISETIEDIKCILERMVEKMYHDTSRVMLQEEQGN